MNFLSADMLTNVHAFFHLNQEFLTSGGFDNEHKDKARYVSNGSANINTDISFSSNHDTRIWLHATNAAATNILIYSPDTDTTMVGCFMITFNKKIVLFNLHTKKILFQV